MRIDLKRPLTEEEAKLTPEQLRKKRLYPPVEQLLEYLYDAMVTGELPKATKFFNAIKAVNDSKK